MSVSIKYDGSTLTEITEEQTITLHTNGMKPKTDIVIENQAQVYYKGELLATLSDGQSMTLHCGGEKLTDDIVVKAVEDDTNISYTLDGYWYIFVNPNKPLANFSEHIAFISDSTNYSKISYDDEGIKYDETIAFSNHPDYLVSKKYEYRLVRFSSPQTVSKEFYEWFTANATNKTITFTIDGAVYQAFENQLNINIKEEGF